MAREVSFASRRRTISEGSVIPPHPDLVAAGPPRPLATTSEELPEARLTKRTSASTLHPPGQSSAPVTPPNLDKLVVPTPTPENRTGEPDLPAPTIPMDGAEHNDKDGDAKGPNDRVDGAEQVHNNENVKAVQPPRQAVKRPQYHEEGGVTVYPRECRPWLDAYGNMSMNLTLQHFLPSSRRLVRLRTCCQASGSDCSREAYQQRLVQFSVAFGSPSGSWRSITRIPRCSHLPHGRKLAASPARIVRSSKTLYQGSFLSCFG